MRPLRVRFSCLSNGTVDLVRSAGGRHRRGPDGGGGLAGNARRRCRADPQPGTHSPVHSGRRYLDADPRDLPLKTFLVPAGMPRGARFNPVVTRYRKGTTPPARGLSRHCHASAAGQASPGTRIGHITMGSAARVAGQESPLGVVAGCAFCAFVNHIPLRVSGSRSGIVG